ncbi:MAG: hypothetical protein ACKO42_02140, partial [Gammaproteobacteria bacterium]
MTDQQACYVASRRDYAQLFCFDVSQHPHPNIRLRESSKFLLLLSTAMKILDLKAFLPSKFCNPGMAFDGLEFDRGGLVDI